MIELGSQYMDRVTKYTGTATAICSYLDATTRVQLSAPLRSDGKFVEPEWFDVARLDSI